MPARLTIGVPTCGRPRAIEACLESIARHVKIEHRVIVVDSLINDRGRAIYGRYPSTVTCIERETPIGPSEGRRLMAEASDTDYLLFLDDDNGMTAGSAADLMAHLDAHPEVGIAAGAWHEEGDEQKRAIGQYFHLGRDAAGVAAIYKEFLTFADAERLGLASFRVDGVQATMMVRRSVWDVVQFDPRYAFFFELFDFFMQCRERGIVIEALPAVIFDHRPVPYEQPTNRQTNAQEDDERRFIDKWGVTPVKGHRASAKAGIFSRRGRR